MKRLIVCCDGTWNRPENQNVTNIEKIARTIEIDSDKAGDVQQLVSYLSGVGSHWYWFDRVLGGAFGFGLFANVTAGYRFLALNYEPGDEIFVFGFSRGAFTARSITGMVCKIGLLTRDALIDGKLPEAVDRYRQAPGQAGAWGSSNAEFKRDNCHEPDVTFLGVFDTVGALGVPGAIKNKHKFHNVNLHPAVKCARHALAIDDRRMKFVPSLWKHNPDVAEDAGNEPDRVKQVWFEGVHSDVGGGYGETGLSDTALKWMADEAAAKGLVFDQSLLDRYVRGGSSAVRHESLNKGYRLLNAMAQLGRLAGKKNPAFAKGYRVLAPPDARDIYISSSALAHFNDDDGYKLGCIQTYVDANDPIADFTVEVVALPESAATETGGAVASEPVGAQVGQ
jgi:uncharacterized protein (DUF2235 family)